MRRYFILSRVAFLPAKSRGKFHTAAVRRGIHVFSSAWNDCNAITKAFRRALRRVILERSRLRDFSVRREMTTNSDVAKDLGGANAPKNNQPKPHTDREATKRTEPPTASRVAYDLTTQKLHKVERTQAHTDRMILNWIGDLCAFLYRMRIL